MTVKLVDGMTLYRPMQYLGAKIRSLEVVGQAIDSLKNQPAVALDLFSGSSVVSQYMKKKGMIVTANDAMKFCSIVAESTIGDVELKNTHEQLLELIGKDVESGAAWELYGDFAKRERGALDKKNPDILIDMYHNLPQAWRDVSISPLAEKGRKCGFDRGDVFSSLYAGTYFGVNQAVNIDYIRNKIEEVMREGLITRYEESLMLTALISAVSKSVFSAGKHFAQPHLIRDGKDQAFILKRIMADRSISVMSEFEKSLEALFTLRANDSSNNSSAIKGSLEDLIESNKPNSYDLIYVDPPYTAQQYSRFYHIPEVLVNYNFPELQMANGNVTRGLYPSDRFKSRFCSKRQAKDAFGDVFKFAERNNSSLIISYSLSKSGVTGNDRMISYEELISMCRAYSGGNVSIVEFDHVYRQFNKKASINNMKEDKEIQIVCERN
jgi:adenine-specific DNA methylase